MGCKPSKESDQVANGLMHKLNKKLSDSWKKETTEALVSNPILNEFKDNLVSNKPEEDIITNNAQEGPAPAKPEDDPTAINAEEGLVANKAEEDPVADKTEEASTNDNENEEKIALNMAIKKEELEENQEEENVVDEVFEKEEIEENGEEVDVADNAIDKEEIDQKEEVNVVDKATIEKEEIEKEKKNRNEEEKMEEVVIEGNDDISSVVDSPDSFASTMDGEVVVVTKFVEGLEAVEEEGVEVEGEVEKVGGEEGNSTNNKDSAELKEKETEAMMEEKERT